MITPQDFVSRWSQSALREQQAAQSHFNELCQLVRHKTPTELDPEGKFFTFEEQVVKATGGSGRADVWYKGHFAWEYKGKHKDLDAAYAQLLAYRGALDNPPLLVVCDFLEYRIYPQWANTSGLPFVFRNEDLLQADTRRFITWLLESPNSFLELRQSELEQRGRLTRQLAEKFAHLDGLMREHTVDGEPPWSSMQIARFLTKLVFALFCEDVDIMPRPFGQPVFRAIVTNIQTLVARDQGENFIEMMTQLFQAMNGERSAFFGLATPYFDGSIFAESAPDAGDSLEVLDLTQIPDGLNLLGEVSEADWRFVNPTIFGTLFEGALDNSKRAQLGAHYTDESDIRLVVDPVLMQPLYRQWDALRAEAEPLMQTYLTSETPRARVEAEARLKTLHDQMMTRLERTTVLDPACGSGNFLYVSLKAMKDLEGRVRKFFEPLGVPFRDVVTPRQLFGIEKDEFAANLAKVVVWIGYLQWRYEDEGILHPVLPNKVTHPRSLPHPIIQDKLHPDETDHIVCDDAIMRYDTENSPYEPDWPAVDTIMGNPPFLGDKKMRGELGDVYVDDLRALYEGCVPGGADLVTYWFEKARAQIEASKANRAGLLATNSIRGGANREVLKRIKDTGDIFMAWSDKEWVLEGAAVRISIVGFDGGYEDDWSLDGNQTTVINPDLTSTVDVTTATPLKENRTLAFQGPVKVGAFDIARQLAEEWLNYANESGYANSDVIKPYLNGEDITNRPRNYSIIDFGTMSLEDARCYEAPFLYVEQEIKPMRLKNKDRQRREYWWRLGRSGDDYRSAVHGLFRQILTPRVAKHRLFIWVNSDVIPSDAVVAIARSDDYFFGALHSYLHEIWSLRMGTWLGKGNDPRYTPTTTFETFPFPWRPGSEDTASPAHAAISAAARVLHEEREAWLNPPDLLALGADPVTSKALKERTLTNLYNALVAYRQGNGAGNGDQGRAVRLVKAARDFAPRLAELHDALDRAVLAAYGWDDLWGSLRNPDGDEELLRRLLALNLERASA